MHLPEKLRRAFGALFILLTIIAGLATAPVAAQAGDATITIHNRICPSEYAGDNYFEDCHDNAPDPGLSFTLADGVTQEDTTNADGDVGFANLQEDTYTITGGVPGEFADYYVYCSLGPSETSTEQPVDFEYVTGGIQIFIPADTNLLCDWYNIPENLRGDPTTTPAPSGEGSITIHNRICPSGYAGDDFFEDCHGNAPDPGLPFSLSDGVTQDGTTNDEGNVEFAVLSPDQYTITGGAPGEFTELYVYCSSDPVESSEENPVEFQYVTGGIQLTLAPDTDVICDWYTIPQDGQGNQFDLPIYKLLCDADPGEQAISEFLTTGPVPEGCEQAAGVSVSVTGADGAEIGSCTTQAEAPCYVTVIVGTTVYGTEDLSTVPEGYVPLNDDTIEVEIPPASEASLLFVNVLAPSTPTPAPPTATSEPLPPGRPLVILDGDCDADQVGDVAYQLEDLRSPVDDEGMDVPGDDVDQEDTVVVAETSSSTIDATLDELMEGDYSIVAFTEGPEPVGVACTEIGGVVNDAGELVIGMQEQGGHGYTGIAYLAPTGDDAATTDISVFLAKDLDDKDLEATPGA